MKEIEAKVLDIDVADLRSRLDRLGATLEFEEEFFAIYYDDPQGSLAQRQQVLRVRREGPDIRLTFKAPHPETEGGIRTREEIELPIGDFETMRTVLQRLGYEEYLKMRKVRTQYSLDGVHVVIDRHIDDLAYIPPYLEIEAPSHAALRETAGRLGIAQERLIDWNAAKVMAHYRDREG